jgi:hypothetical protein
LTEIEQVTDFPLSLGVPCHPREPQIPKYIVQRQSISQISASG